METLQLAVLPKQASYTPLTCVPAPLNEGVGIHGAARERRLQVAVHLRGPQPITALTSELRLQRLIQDPGTDLLQNRL